MEKRKGALEKLHWPILAQNSYYLSGTFFFEVNLFARGKEKEEKKRKGTTTLFEITVVENTEAENTIKIDFTKTRRASTTSITLDESYDNQDHKNEPKE